MSDKVQFNVGGKGQKPSGDGRFVCIEDARGWHQACTRMSTKGLHACDCDAIKAKVRSGEGKVRKKGRILRKK
jgi:hypothetical protein